MYFFMWWILKDFLVQNTHKTSIQQSHLNPQDFLWFSKTFFLADRTAPGTLALFIYIYAKPNFQMIFQDLIRFFTIAFQKYCSSFFSYIYNRNSKIIIAYNIVSRFIICIESSYIWLEKIHIQILQFLFLSSFFFMYIWIFFQKSFYVYIIDSYLTKKIWLIHVVVFCSIFFFEIVLCIYDWFIIKRKFYYKILKASNSSTWFAKNVVLMIFYGNLLRSLIFMLPNYDNNDQEFDVQTQEQEREDTNL
jgi:hypothetical protein